MIWTIVVKLSVLDDKMYLFKLRSKKNDLKILDKNNMGRPLVEVVG